MSWNKAPIDTLIGCLLPLALLCCSSTCLAGSATEWLGKMEPGDLARGAFGFGAWPGYEDGWDGEPPATIPTDPAVYFVLFRANGPSWSGATGFYSSDIESPIPLGGSKTWSDIRLWSYDYAPRPGLGVGYHWIVKPPAGYTGILTIDHVPAHLNWTGPYEFRIDLTKTQGFQVPIPITDDPYNPANVTRMHLTVYTVPEASSLAALVFALAGFGASVVRRRRA